MSQRQNQEHLGMQTHAVTSWLHVLLEIVFYCKFRHKDFLFIVERALNDFSLSPKKMLTIESLIFKN